MLRVGQNIRIDGQMGIIVYVNRLLRCYQVKFEGKENHLYHSMSWKEKKPPHNCVVKGRSPANYRIV